MAEVSLEFNYPLNESCQIGDIAYYQDVYLQNSGFQTPILGDEPTEIGIIKQIQHVDNDGDGNYDATQLTCDINPTTIPPSTATSFIFFGKDRRVNESAVLGYYSEMKFENNSREKAELFTAACEVTGNS